MVICYVFVCEQIQRKEFYTNEQKIVSGSVSFLKKIGHSGCSVKAQTSGFSISPEALLITPAPFRTFYIAKEEKTYKATINMVDFNGMLKVNDTEKLLLSLARGIGPAKGLGVRTFVNIPVKKRFNLENLNN